MADSIISSNFASGGESGRGALFQGPDPGGKPRASAGRSEVPPCAGMPVLDLSYVVGAPAYSPHCGKAGPDGRDDGTYERPHLQVQQDPHYNEHRERPRAGAGELGARLGSSEEQLDAVSHAAPTPKMSAPPSPPPPTLAAYGPPSALHAAITHRSRVRKTWSWTPCTRAASRKRSTHEAIALLPQSER